MLCEGLTPDSEEHSRFGVILCLLRAFAQSEIEQQTAGVQVRVLGEGFTPEDEEDSAAAEVSKVWAYQARYRVPLSKAVAGTRFLLPRH